MIRKCGRDSKIPAMMAVDALSAGVDTTGNTGIGARGAHHGSLFPCTSYVCGLSPALLHLVAYCFLLYVVYIRVCLTSFPYIICLPTFVSVFMLLYTFVCLFSLLHCFTFFPQLFMEVYFISLPILLIFRSFTCLPIFPPFIFLLIFPYFVLFALFSLPNFLFCQLYLISGLPAVPPGEQPGEAGEALPRAPGHHRQQPHHSSHPRTTTLSQGDYTSLNYDSMPIRSALAATPSQLTPSHSYNISRLSF